MRSRIRAGLVMATVLCIGLSSRAFATDFVVTKTADTNDGACNSNCSLRDAIIAANANLGADRVILGSGLMYSLTLGPFDPPGPLVPGSGDLDITDALTIEGNGSTVNANSIDRAFSIQGNFAVTINNLTITGGLAQGFLSLGGGIAIRGATVALNNCSVSGNSTATEGGRRDDGGGIAVVGSFDAPSGATTLARLTLNGSNVSGNASSNGGGIVCDLCALTITHSTISSNTASGDGGGIDLLGNASTMTMTGSNLAGNSATRGGGLAVPFGTSVSVLNFDRITGNAAGTGGAMFNNSGSVNIENNWWGCNYGPGAPGSGCAASPNGVAGLFTLTRYLVLGVTAPPTSVHPSTTSTVTANLTINSLAADTSGSGAIPDGTSATFSTSGGAFATPSSLTAGGKATDVLTPNGFAGTATISTTVDAQTVAMSLTMYLNLPFTDDPLVSGVTPVKAIHINELRTRIDNVRIAHGLTAFAYTYPAIVSGSFIHAQDVVDLRTALGQAYAAMALTPPAYTDPALSAGTFIKTVHIMEIRSALANVE